MIKLLGPLVLTIAGGVVYHLAAKSVPKTLNPALALVGVYTTALLASAVAYLCLPVTPATPHAARPWDPMVIAVGLGAAAIELGYLLIYRAAWPISIASVIINGIVALLLVPIGIGLFGEPLTPARVLGVVLYLAGVSLLQR